MLALYPENSSVLIMIPETSNNSEKGPHLTIFSDLEKAHCSPHYVPFLQRNRAFERKPIFFLPFLALVMVVCSSSPGIQCAGLHRQLHANVLGARRFVYYIQAHRRSIEMQNLILHERPTIR